MPSKQKASFEQANVIEEAKIEKDLRPSRPSIKSSQRSKPEVQVVDETRELLTEEEKPANETTEEGRQSRAESKKSSQTVSF